MTIYYDTGINHCTYNVNSILVAIVFVNVGGIVTLATSTIFCPPSSPFQVFRTLFSVILPLQIVQIYSIHSD